jgi:hydrogenase maturation factor
VTAAGRDLVVDLVMTPEAGVGDHVLVHAGYSVRVLLPDEAKAMTGELAAVARLPAQLTSPSTGSHR